MANWSPTIHTIKAVPDETTTPRRQMIPSSNIWRKRTQGNIELWQEGDILARQLWAILKAVSRMEQTGIRYMEVGNILR